MLSGSPAKGRQVLNAGRHVNNWGANEEEDGVALHV